MKKFLREMMRDIDLRVLVVVSFLTSLTLCVFAPLELYFGNKQEFWFEIASLMGAMFICFVVLLMISLVVGILLKGKARTIWWCIIFGLGLAFYLQANFLNGEMGVMNGQEIDWCADKKKLIMNIFIWLFCVVVPILFGIFVKKRWTTLVFVLSAMLIGMQLSAVVSLALTISEKQQSVCLTTDGIYTLSTNDNIIVFVLDTLDAQYFEKYVKDNPKHKKNLEQYTYFDNAVGGGGPTVYGLPILLTGQYYDGGRYENYLESAYEKSNLYNKLESNDWDTRVYTLEQFVADDFYLTNIDNAEKLVTRSSQSSDTKGFAKKLYQAAWYKYFPNIVKNKFFYYTEEFERFRPKEDAGSGDAVYSMDDERFISGFRKNGITCINDKNAYRFYHLFGAHGPYNLNENGEYIESGTSIQEQIDGVWNMLGEYFEQMKKMGIYDNSTIIIIGDHGAYDIYQNPCVLIKEKKSERTALGVLHAPITFQNILPTLSEAIDGINNENEKTVFEIGENEDNVRFQVVDPALAKQFYGQGEWEQPLLFSIKGDARKRDGLTDLGQINMIYNEAPLYHLGDKISFTKEGNGLQYLCEGFSAPEDNGIWTVSGSALQKIRLDTQPINGLNVNIGLENIFTGRQHITIWFNNSCVYSQYQTEKEISFKVPKDIVADGEQVIRYRLTTAVPSEVTGSADERPLSIKINNMMITEVDEEVVPVIDETSYTLGDKIVFTKENDGTRFFVDGISGVEVDSAWSLGKVSEVELGIENNASNLTGEICFESVFAAPQKIIISCKDNVSNILSIGDISVQLTQDEKKDIVLWEGIILSPEQAIVFDIPAELIKNNRLNLELKYPDAKSPFNTGESEDKRVLSVKFSSMKFTQKE